MKDSQTLRNCNSAVSKDSFQGLAKLYKVEKTDFPDFPENCLREIKGSNIIPLFITVSSEKGSIILNFASQ